MPLASQVVDVKFTQGLDTRTQSKLVLPGKWDSLINLSLSEDGSLKRRAGYEVVVSGATGNGLATHGNQLLVVDGPALTTVDPVAKAERAVAGLIGNVGIRKTEVRRTTGMQDTPDCATGTPSGATGPYTAYAWREKSAVNAALSINCTIIEEASGARVIDNLALRTSATAFGVRVVFADSRFFFFYIDGTSLRCTVVDPVTATAGADTALITSASLSGINFDAVQFPSDSEATVLYGWADAVSSGRVVTIGQAANVPSISAGPTIVFNEATSPIASMQAFAIAEYSAGTLGGCFALNDTSGLIGATIDATTAVVTAETVINAGTGSTTNAARHLTAVVDSTRMRLLFDFVSEWNTNAVNPITAQVVSTTLVTFAGPTNIINSNTFGAGTTARGPQGPFIHGKAFSEGGRIFLPVYVSSVYASLAGAAANPRSLNSQNTLFILDNGATGGNIASGVVVAKALYGVYGVASINANPPTVGTPCSSPEVSSGDFITVSGELMRLVVTNAGNISPTGIVRIDMLPQFVAPPERLEFGEETFFGGGSVAQFDGSIGTEVGFPLYPEGVAITALGAGGAMTAGQHVVTVVYEWVDGAGNRVQSAPCPPITITTVANDSLSVFVPTLQLSQKTNIEVWAYMTQAAGLTFNRVLLNNALYAPVINTTAANTVTLTIDDADATIAGNELLYTQPLQGGATLANVAPNPMHGIGVSQNRLWGFLSDEPNEYACSQELLPNTALQFNNNALGGRVPSAAGDGVKIHELDEKTILFCERKIYVVYGSGPDPSGANSNFSEPQAIPSDVGCVEARSVLSIPSGVMFKSSKGWYLLGRDLVTRYIGEGVTRWDSYSISSAVLLEDEQEARFTSVDPEAPTLVYSYLLGQWSVYYMGSALRPGGLADAVWWSATGRYAHLQTSSGQFPGVMQETPGVYVDGAGAGTPLQALIYARTSFLHAAALEAFQRVRWLYLTATAAAAPTNTLAVTVDFDDVYGALHPAAYSFNVLLSSLGTPAPDVQAIDFRHKIRNLQKCKSIAFSFLEGGVLTSNATPLTGLQAMALELGLKKGVNRLRAAQSF